MIVPDQDNGELEQCIKHVLKQRGLQKPQPFVTKVSDVGLVLLLTLLLRGACCLFNPGCVTAGCLQVIQLYDTMNVRFGVMLVGPSGGGKTVCYKTLQGAQTRLRADLRHSNPAFQVSLTA